MKDHQDRIEDTNLRREALDHAVRLAVHPINPKAVVTTAKVFYAFLINRSR